MNVGAQPPWARFGAAAKRRRSQSINGPGVFANLRSRNSWRLLVAPPLKALRALPKAAKAVARPARVVGAYFLQLKAEAVAAASSKTNAAAKRPQPYGNCGTGASVNIPAPPAYYDAHQDLRAWPVPRLIALAQQRGVDIRSCKEKADIMILLGGRGCCQTNRGAAPAAQSVPPTPRRAQRRSTPASSPMRKPCAKRRSSVLNMASPKGSRRDSLGSAARLSARQREELRRIARAVDDLAVLGLTWDQLAMLPSRQEQQRVVLKRSRDVSRLVHPDKCAAELRDQATRAFQRLQLAKQNVSQSLAHPTYPTPGNSVASGFTAAQPTWGSGMGEGCPGRHPAADPAQWSRPY